MGMVIGASGAKISAGGEASPPGLLAVLFGFKTSTYLLFVPALLENMLTGGPPLGGDIDAGGPGIEDIFGKPDGGGGGGFVSSSGAFKSTHFCFFSSHTIDLFLSSGR